MAAARMSATRIDPSPPPDDNVARLRVPPHSPEGEQSVLACLMLDNAAWPVATELVREQDFYRYENRLIFSAIGDLIEDGQPADPITVFERLRANGRDQESGGLAYLNALFVSVPSARNLRAYAEAVRERALRRRLIAATDEIATAAFSPQGRALPVLLEEAAAAVRTLAADAPAAGSLLLDLAALEGRAQAVSWVVKHAVPAESLGLMFGGPGTFKSYIALDLALHVCRGMPWLGRRTKQGPVIYVAAEGGTGLWGRVRAWHQQRRLQVKDSPLYVVPAALDMQADAGRLAEAAEAAKVTPALVVVDTLSQTFSGEENSANEVAAYLRALGAAFRERWRCAVLVIHHTGHQATERPRGSSAIKGNVDFMLGVFRDENERIATVECARQKDGDTFDDVTFYLSSVDLGKDPDGDPVVQLVASHIRDGVETLDAVKHEVSRGRKGRNAILLELLQAMDGQAEKDVRIAFQGRCGLDNEATKRQAWKRAIDWAVRNGVAAIEQGTVKVLRRLD